MLRKITYILILLFVIDIGSALAQEKYERPNIVIILADDLGYGDIASYDSEYAKIPTPNTDKLVDQGIHFTDAHSPSSVCTPTRYGLLTGRYAWRTRLQRGVLRPYDPPLITAGRLTLASLLRKQDFHTALIGKWHLGWEWPKGESDKRIRFDKPIAQGPTTRGFDYYFGGDVPNHPPYTYIENGEIVTPPTAYFQGNKKIVVNTPGPMAPGWQFDKVMPTLVEKAEAYIRDQANKKDPFFLLFSLTIPHEPITPSKSFQGQSGINGTGDLIVEVDNAVGKVMKALDKHGITDNTLLIFTSDNGHSPYTGLEDFEKADHRVSGPFRGVKSNIWEGGHRIPFIARWPGIVDPGSHSDQMIVLTDIFATFADIFNTKLPQDAGEDSKSILPLLKGDTKESIRNTAIFHSVDGRFAIKKGPWKLILGPGSGGYGAGPSDKAAIKEGLPAIQLYNLSKDPGEQNNLHSNYPEIVKELTNLLVQHIKEGRSTPGTPQDNEGNVMSNINPYIENR